MKSTIKIFAVFAIVLGFAVGAKAQDKQSDNKTITAKAQVIKALKVTAGDDLSFGLVTQSVTKTINSAGNVIAGTTGTGGALVGGEKAGTFTIEKGLNTGLTIEFELPSNLTQSGHDPLAINFLNSGLTPLAKLTGGTADYPFTPGGTGSGLTINTSVSNYYAIGSFGVSIGGTVVPTATQDEGVYTGTIKLIATYN